MKLLIVSLLFILNISHAYSYENQSCQSKYDECDKIHTVDFCKQTIGTCQLSPEEIKEKRKSLKGFISIKITSSLDGRYFKSGTRHYTVKGVEYPGISCNLEKGDDVYIVSHLVENSGKNSISFIKVYSLEKDSYCELM
jgi:hypothetical protein